MTPETRPPSRREALLATADYLAERAENMRFARQLQLAGRAARGLPPFVPNDEADMPWVKLGVDEIDAIVKDMRDAADLLREEGESTYDNVWIVTEYDGGGIRGVYRAQAAAEAGIQAILDDHPDLQRSDFVIQVERVQGEARVDVREEGDQ